MRVISEIQHPHFKITIFHWNNRYLVKMEAGFFEQTFKISELDVSSEEELRQMIDQNFLDEAALRFETMAKSWHASLQRHT